MGSCFSPGGINAPIVDLDLDAAPNEIEEQLDRTLTKILSKRQRLIQTLSQYKSCEKYIKDALSDPTPETEAAAWNAVQQAVDQLYKFYIYSLSLDTILEKLLIMICNTQNAYESLLIRQASIGKLSQIFEFAFNFDEQKMSKPAIQNDFSYYRRVLSRYSSNTHPDPNKTKKPPKVTEEVANRMSFHFAYPVPVMKVLSDRITHLQDIKCIPVLSLITTVCCDMIMTQTIKDDQKPNILKLMSGCIIFLDHLAIGGVFHKKSPINIKHCLIAVKLHGGEASYSLMNGIRFSSLHLKDETTLPSVTRLFD